MAQIICSQTTYDTLCDRFKRMDFKADEYVPTINELENVIRPRLKEFIEFLLWIDATGIRTESNQAVHDKIWEIIHNDVQIVQDKDLEKIKEKRSKP